MKWKVKYSDIVVNSHLSIISLHKVSRLGNQSGLYGADQKLYKCSVTFAIPTFSEAVYYNKKGRPRYITS